MSSVVDVGWLPWALAAVAAWAGLPRGRAAPRHAEAARRRTTSRARSPRHLAAGVAAAVSAGCVTIGGWPAGVVAAVTLAPLAVAGVRGLSVNSPGSAGPPEHDGSLALALDLAAVVLESGRTLADTLTLVAPVTASAGPALDRVGVLLRLGAEPGDAWSAVPADSPVAAVARAAVRSDASGARLAAVFERSAQHIRAEVHAAGLARAARAGTSALAPLALCFLPSFVCLGIVPAVVGIAKTALRQVA